MSWAASRNITKEKDLAYCLLGIFNVAMPMLYGLSGLAFRVLQEEIIKKTKNDSILAWGLAPTNARRVVTYGVLAVSPLSFAACGDISGRERLASKPLYIRDGSLNLLFHLHKTPATGETLGLLECGPKDDMAMVVGIPLVPPAWRTTWKIRPPTRPPEPVITSTKECWFRVCCSVSDLELIEVEPPNFWDSKSDGRHLIKVVAAPDGDGPPRTWARFRRGGGMTSFWDFVVALDHGSPRRQAQCHVIIASRETSLRDIAGRFADIPPGALGRQSASDGDLGLSATLDPATKPW
ncbi:hypothetical protein MAPG_05667 [Magnaporthiopsis poae ATCC 64411]|uniref:Uncharacterized protein n=1 Tax=Magnaporthiopsis poae (strain ATCC 64411 / 73-15) TaxID=644358 RepID=A0A0C4E003_MAGP6|nr:hypothetical protein MAPG_05667 [Magnaporthiopsis poae ATCC 64411]